MQRTVIILACLFSLMLIGTNLFAQQYPFVHYTPKDGLISNQIRNIYQDSKGRLYFFSINGLSVYDGSRFTNYTTKNGLGLDIINCVMEMGDDSIWIVTNSAVINCLVKGKMKKLDLEGAPIVINRLIKDDNNILYAASEQGLYKFDQNGFIKLPFNDTKGEDRSRFLSSIYSYGHYLLLQRDPSLLPGEEHVLYLFNTKMNKIVAEIRNILTIDKAPDGRIWVSTKKKILALDTIALNKNELVLQDLPSPYDKLRNLGGYFILFDSGNNCWLGDQDRNLLKTEPGGQVTSFTKSSGLSMSFINAIFLDRENITWIATNNAGVNKLVQSNFSLLENPFGFGSFSYNLSYRKEKDHLLLYSSKDSRLAIVKNDSMITYLDIRGANEIEKIVETPYGFYGTALNKIYKLTLQGNTLVPGIVFIDSTDAIFGGSLVDKNGNLIVCGKNKVIAIVNGTSICQRRLNFFADQPAMDSKGNIWVATRAHELTMFRPDPGNPLEYLELKNVFSRELSELSPRSITFDGNDNLWIGTRNNGIHVFRVENGKLNRTYQISTATGLSDDFITHLVCDRNNNVWASSALGLDKLSINNGLPVIENVTKQNNIYQSVFKVVTDQNNTVLGLVSGGLIRIVSEDKRPTEYTPTLMVTTVKAGKDTVYDRSSFSHKQNNIIFNFSATSYLDEKQILYSYRLNGGSNDHWSEPSNNSTVSFIDLPPGNYTLDIKATFPARRYPEQVINYKFSISPAWWQTWWFKAAIVLSGIAILVTGIRFYYRRRLEKEKAILEKQQAIEKERTRIATDMHDDLGAGLSRIKFLGQSLMNKKKDDIIKNELEKITAVSDEMSEKMGEIIWALNEKNDTLADLIAYTRSYAAEYLGSHHIECEAITPMNLPVSFITGEMRRNIFLSVKECLHNVVKHAGATKVHFHIQLNHNMQIVIHDNGKGIDWNSQRPFSNGIQNIEKRMKEINGKVGYSNEHGTKVSLTIPVAL